jgi:hypothetical protein
MGYTTRFRGELKFTHELSVPQLKKLESMFGADCREHPEWGPLAAKLYYIDFETTSDYSGLVHNDSEKSYDAEEQINVILQEMRKIWPEFGLTGQLMAQGQDLEDRWALVMEDGLAHKRKIAVTGSRVECPECGHKFILEETAKS